MSMFLENSGPNMSQGRIELPGDDVFNKYWQATGEYGPYTYTYDNQCADTKMADLLQSQQPNTYFEYKNKRWKFQNKERNGEQYMVIYVKNLMPKQTQTYTNARTPMNPGQMVREFRMVAMLPPNIDTGQEGEGVAEINDFGKEGFRVVSMCPIPNTDKIAVAMER